MKGEKKGAAVKPDRVKIEKLLMILLPCAAILISYYILAPQLKLLYSHVQQEKYAASAPAVAADAVAAEESPEAAAEFVPIEDVSRLLDILDVREMDAGEIKDNTPHASQPTVPEIIYTQELQSSNPLQIFDSMGRPLYTYSFKTGSTGCLLYRGSGEESDVIPVDENGDGVLDYGLRYISEGYFESVTLFNGDNSPVDEYDISAIPLTRPEGSNVGWKTENGKTYYYGQNGLPVTGLKSIDGKLYYFNQWGEKASRIGVDVSCFNGMVNYAAVKAQGVDFVLVRIGGRGWESGLVYVDSMAMDHLRSAKAAGLKVGVYFYSTAVNVAEAVQEASLIIEQLDGMELEMPVFIDMEYSGSFPRGRADALNTAQRVEIISAFCKTMENCGYKAGIYSGESLLNSSVDHSSIEQYCIWLANYTENNALPTYPHRYDIWQFTDRGVVEGMGGNVDINVIF